MAKEEMSHEEAMSLKNLITGAIDAHIAAEKTGQSAGLTANQDQLKAHEKEFNSSVKIDFSK